MKTLWLASGNEHKKREIAEIFERYEIKIPAELGLAFAPTENGATFLENALLKARALYELVGEPVLADDSGLCVDALQGRPGIYSARYGSTTGKLTSEERNKLLLQELGTNPLRRARFVCAMVLFLGGERFFAVQETLEGEILSEPRGLGGFGYDPIVLVPGLGRTVAELSAAEKNHLSHRGKAGAALRRLVD
jgi:XTP/dITP diphosphohydrolase